MSFKHLARFFAGSLIAVFIATATFAAPAEEPLLPAGTKNRDGSPSISSSSRRSTALNLPEPKPNPKPKAKPKPKPKPKTVVVESMGPEVPPDIDVLQEQTRVIRFANSHLQKLRWDNRDCAECYAATAGNENSTLESRDPNSPGEDLRNLPEAERERILAKRACFATWKEFYNKAPEDPLKPDGPKKPIDIRLVLGHLDSEFDSFVSDGVLRQSMIKTITAPCEANNLVRVCGFKESIKDGDVFESEVLGPGNLPQKVRITLAASSSASAVLTKHDQERLSASAEKTYFDGIKESDVLLYVGHARKGGGPDFRPAKTKPGGRLTDFEYYRKNQPGLKALDAAFSAAKVDGKSKTPKIMGFYACNADVWRARLRRHAPNSGLIISGTDEVEFQTLLGMAYLTIDSVLWQRCPDEFDRAMNTLIDYRKQKLVPLVLDGFFKK